MSPTSYIFQYNAENLHAFSSAFGGSNIVTIVILLGLIGTYAAVYFLAPHIYSSFIYREKKQEKQVKRNLIKDLILMKEIQTEIEKEIEQSLLNIGMHKNA